VSLANAVAKLESERDELAGRLQRLAGVDAEVVRRVYRRGYWAGRSAQRRGRGIETAPERHARGEIRALLAEPSNQQEAER
jgi:hypothetical protein